MADNRITVNKPLTVLLSSIELRLLIRFMALYQVFEACR